MNALAPGIIKTQFSRALWESPDGIEKLETHPVSRLGNVGDLAGAALLLVSESSSFITGHTLVIDGVSF